MKKNEFNQEKITERVRELISEFNVTPRRFAIEAKIDPSNFARKIIGKLPWTVNDINKLSSNLHVQRAWIVEGEGQMLKEQEQTQEQKHDTRYKPDTNRMMENAAVMFTDQVLQIEKLIIILKNEISEIRSIKEEIIGQKMELKKLQNSLHDAIFALRSSKPDKQTNISIVAENGV